MSSSSAGKFQDHYSMLGVETNCDSEALQTAYTRLAEKYHPSKPGTGDQGKFDAINLAYETLSDPGLRTEFDKIKGVNQEIGGPKFSGEEFFAALGRGTDLRVALLCLLYDRRRTKPYTPSLSMRNIEAMLDCSIEELNFALWYLKQRQLAVPDDKSSLLITVEGMDFLEKNQPSPEAILGVIKPAFVDQTKSQVKRAPVPALASSIVTGNGGSGGAGAAAVRTAINRTPQRG